MLQKDSTETSDSVGQGFYAGCDLPGFGSKYPGVLSEAESAVKPDT